MKKLSIVIGFCFLSSVGAAFASAKPLCSLPNWSVTSSVGGSRLAVFLDSRYLNVANYGNVSTPEGGVKFELALLDKVTQAATITRVQYSNLTQKEIHVISGGDYVFPDGTKTREYPLWLGQARNLLGDWKLTIVTSDVGTFSHTFTITQEMLDANTKPPRPSMSIAKSLDAQNNLTGYKVTASSPYLMDMKARIMVFEDNDDDILYISQYKIITGTKVRFVIPKCFTSGNGTDCDLTNNKARIEVKNADGTVTPWIIYLYNQSTRTCETNPFPGRTLLIFKFPQ